MKSYRRIEISEIHGITHVSFVDRRMIDEVSIQELGEDLLRLVQEHPSAKLVLDFSHVEFLSSAGLGKFVTLHRAVKKGNSRLILTNLQPTIAEVFVHTRLNELFEITTDGEQAVQALQRESGPSSH